MSSNEKEILAVESAVKSALRKEAVEPSKAERVISNVDAELTKMHFGSHLFLDKSLHDKFHTVLQSLLFSMIAVSLTAMFAWVSVDKIIASQVNALGKSIDFELRPSE